MAFLHGEASEWQAEKLTAASWFSDANKLYNSGQSPFREGAISPWAMALVCKGLGFFAGGASRRLGARTSAPRPPPTPAPIFSYKKHLRMRKQQCMLSSSIKGRGGGVDHRNCVGSPAVLGAA